MSYVGIRDDFEGSSAEWCTGIIWPFNHLILVPGDGTEYGGHIHRRREIRDDRVKKWLHADVIS